MVARDSNAHVVGRITEIQDSERRDCNSRSPATSTHRGPDGLADGSAFSTERVLERRMGTLTTQKTPRIAPLMMANAMVGAKVVDGSQIAKQEIPHANVSTSATSYRPYLSLSTPMQGRPIAVPRLSSALVVAACPDERPMERAKSGSEYSNTTYTPAYSRTPTQGEAGRRSDEQVSSRTRAGEGGWHHSDSASPPWQCQQHRAADQASHTEGPRQGHVLDDGFRHE